MEKDIREKRAYIWCFGKNANGELGVANSKDILVPRYVKIKSGQNAKWVSSGSHHSAIVTKTGELYVSGSSLHGKLGISSINMM